MRKKKMFLFLIIIVLIIAIIVFLNYIFLGVIMKEKTDNIIVKNGEIEFNSLSLRQKIAQMIVVRGDDDKNIKMAELNIGGIFLDSQKSEEDYINLISKYKKNSKINLFVATDLEGAWNPFASFKKFPSFSDLDNDEDAYSAGLEQGELLKKLGFNLNFAPVSEFYDESYGGRTFLGTKEEVKDKLESYILGLQENVFGTCKHYPGKGMINNLHENVDKQNISKEDLELFDICFKNNVSAVMVGHQIVEGEIDSSGKPSSVSLDIISILDDKGVLVISDEINMKGLSNFYNNKAEMYQDLINSGENLILDFSLDYKSGLDLIKEIEEKVRRGEISEENINKSVRKILIMKGYKI